MWGPETMLTECHLDRGVGFSHNIVCVCCRKQQKAVKETLRFKGNRRKSPVGFSHKSHRDVGRLGDSFMRVLWSVALGNSG